MVAADFLQDPRVQGWLDGVEPAWTLLTFESLRALRHEPSAVQTAIRIDAYVGCHGLVLETFLPLCGDLPIYLRCRRERRTQGPRAQFKRIMGPPRIAPLAAHHELANSA
jgi:hypothetical protein